jgi:hypothetical protein
MIVSTSKNRFSKFTLLLINLIVPTYYVPILAVGESGLAVRSFDLVALALPFLLLFAPSGWWAPGQFLTMFLWMCAFAASVAVSTGALFFTHCPAPTEVERIARAVLRLYEVFVLAAVAINALRHVSVRQAVNVTLVLCAVLPASSFYQEVTSGSDFTRIGGYAVTGSADSGIEGKYSVQGNFNELGALCGALGAGSGGLFFGAKTWRLRMFYLALLSLYTGGVVLTGSRSGLAAEAIGLFVVALLLRGSLVRKCMVLLVPLLVIVMIPRLFDLAYRRIYYTFIEGSHSYASATYRFDTMLSAWNVFAEQPCFGVGYASFRLFSVEGFITPECYYLEVLADLGLLGAFAFCGLVIYPIWKGWMLTGEAREIYYAAGLAPVIVLLASSVSGNNLFDPSLMMLFLVFSSFGISQQSSGVSQQIPGIRRVPARRLAEPPSRAHVARRS